MPKVSVIIPVYKVERYIERCAKTLFEQSLDDIEYLFIDDCSPDNSIVLLNSVLDNYPNRKDQVVIHRMEHNSGQAAVRKWGVLHSTGDYIIHCDSDDWLDKDAYKLMYEEAIKNDYDIVVCNYYEVDGADTYRLISQSFSHERKIMMFSFITLWCKLVKKSLYFDNHFVFPTGNIGEDRVYTVQLAWYARSFGFVNKPLYYYFINTNSITHETEPEKSLQLFKQRKANTDMISQFIIENGIDGCGSEIARLKLGALMWLEPHLNKLEFKRLWKQTYPELIRNCLFLPGVGLKNRFRYLYTRLYLFFN